jgi:hypothetical protein
MSLPQNRNIFAEYKGDTNVFIETGMYRGDGIQSALDAGFKQIISIDNDDQCLFFCMDRFDIDNNWDSGIKFLLADSATTLQNIINKIDEPILFWLDAHWQFIEGTPKGANPFPLLKELEQIAKHNIKSHTIIIDDWHIFYKDRVGYSKNDIKKALFNINPSYKLTFVANPVIDGILIAHI